LAKLLRREPGGRAGPGLVRQHAQDDRHQRAVVVGPAFCLGGQQGLLGGRPPPPPGADRIVGHAQSTRNLLIVGARRRGHDDLGAPHLVLGTAVPPDDSLHHPLLARRQGNGLWLCQ
jgi:hypothetical protein